MAFFTNQTARLTENRAQLNYGVAVADIDDDGAFEIYVTGFSGPSQVLKWQGDSFVEIATNTPLSNAGGQAIGVAAADIDGDGREELYVLNTDVFAGRKQTGDRLYKFVDGRWIDIFTLPENHDRLNLYAGRSVGCIDRLGIGHYGFFVANYGGPMRLYELLDSSLELIDAAPELGLNFVTGGRAVVPAPIMSSRTDLFLNNENGANYLLFNNGDGTFTEMAEALGLDDPFEHGRGTAVLDANGDGFLDIAYGNWEGANRLYLREGNHFYDATPATMQRPSRIRTVIAADFDNDGVDEIFWHNLLQPNRLFKLRHGIWEMPDIGDALEPLGAGTGAAIGDFDGDGRLELLLSHGESVLQPLTFYTVHPDIAAGNHYLRVKVLTSVGAPARGALVRLRANGKTQIKVIDAGSGYLCQMEPIAHFGLGPSTHVDWVEVVFPDTTIQRVVHPAVDQVLTVQKAI
ncbi:MAG: CRTAC1 family protein [Anaerolineae bacterium]